MSGPRIPPLPETEWDEGQRVLIGQNWSGPPPGNRNNLYRTLARHRELLRVWGEFGRTVLHGGLAARERELVVLRVAWLTGCAFEWAYHVPLARREGLSEEEISRVAGARDPAWADEDVALLMAVDELEEASTLTETTWAALRRRHDEQRLIEILTVVGQYRLVAGITNASRIAPAAGLPTVPTGRGGAASRAPGRVGSGEPRILPLPWAEWDEQRVGSGPSSGDGTDLHRTWVRHREIYRTWSVFDQLLQDGMLTPRERHLLGLRTAWRSRCALLWAHHGAAAPAAGLTPDEVEDVGTGPWAPRWSEAESALLAAADELYDTCDVSAGTWAVLVRHHDEPTVLELLASVGNHRLVAFLANALGIRPAAGAPVLPAGSGVARSVR
ncbi:carboxymuconolactone decarboxylase family protein [Pseudonocardia sp. GCM10023141]|uniref:carboxymuconolactone decarboxylase family protein n=1 Tax=Pseudonocardia sp. GCM10023141 TaxID=3252653 RepID=UPI00361CE15A